MKYKVIKEFSLLDNNKIILLKANTIINDFTIMVDSSIINITSDIINKNPEYFELVNWENELLIFLKKNKIPKPAIMVKQLKPWVEETFIDTDDEKISKSDLENLLN